MSRTIILAYHRIAEVPQDPHLLCVSQERFADQLEQLRLDADVVPLRQVQERAPGRRVAITFDDGYSDNALVAAPILESLSIPATFFVTTGKVGSASRFWWDALATLVLAAPEGSRVSAAFDGDVAPLDLSSVEQRLRTHATLHKRLRSLPPAKIEHIVGDLGLRLGSPLGAAVDDRSVTQEELRRLSNDLFEVGSHSVSHPLLSARSPEEQQMEISDSREQLEAMVGVPILSFSYPFGGRDAFKDDTVGMVRQAGYVLACTGIAGRVSRRTDPLRLPRHFVRNLDRNDFAQWLSRRFATR